MSRRKVSRAKRWSGLATAPGTHIIYAIKRLPNWAIDPAGSGHPGRFKLTITPLRRRAAKRGSQ